MITLNATASQEYAGETPGGKNVRAGEFNSSLKLKYWYKIQGKVWETIICMPASPQKNLGFNHLSEV